MFVHLLQVIIDEFAQRVEETHTRGVGDDAVAQKASKVLHAAKAVKNSKAGKTPGAYFCLIVPFRVQFIVFFVSP